MDEKAQAVATAVAQVMYDRDDAARMLGMTVERVAPGEARVVMAVRPDMINGHDIVHGGLVFTLADAAFAYACNAYDRLTVASGAQIDFVSPGYKGETLVAQARERHRGKRTGVYDVEVTDAASGRLIAVFRGRSYSLDVKVTDAYIPR
jgi:acyl-CoA thioesterase